MWQSRNSSNQCPPRTHAHPPSLPHTHTGYATHPQRRCSPVNRALWTCETIFVCRCSRSIGSSHARGGGGSIRLYTTALLLASKRERSRTFVTRWPWTSQAAILPQPPRCGHFVSLPLSTRRSLSRGCQMARVRYPPPPTHTPVMCECLEDRQIDGQTARQKEGR